MSRDLDSVLLQLYARTPAPCRDYCGLTITTTDVILNVWNITFGPHVYPRRHKCSLENFEQDKYFQMEVRRVFGENVYEYVMSLSKNEINLQNLPTKAFLHILKYLAARDIVRLSQTSKIMFEVMRRFRKVMKRQPDRQDKIIAEKCGWKETLREKLMRRGRKSDKSVPASTKNNVNKSGTQKRVSFTSTANNNIKIIQQKDAKTSVPAQVINKIKVDTVKSTSALATVQKNLKKTDHIKSAVNLNPTNAISKTLSQTKTELKINSANKIVKNTNIKSQMNAHNLFEKSEAIKKVTSINLKSTVQESIARSNSATVKNKSKANKK